MKPFVLALTVAAACPSAALAYDKAVYAPIAKFGATFNVGDVPGAAATMVPGVVIADETAPFLWWQGKSGFQDWVNDLSAAEKAKGYSDQHVKIGLPKREVIGGNKAYVIVPSDYGFTRGGVKYHEVAQMTFTLVKGSAGWKISSWTWTGAAAVPVK